MGDPRYGPAPLPEVRADVRGSPLRTGECPCLGVGADRLSVIRPPSAQERDALLAALADPSRRNSGSWHSSQDKELRAALTAAEEWTVELARCPVCERTNTTFEARDDDLFAAVCSSCGTRWETRRCPRGHTVPVFDPDATGGPGGSEEELDDRLGGAVLAPPCWAKDSPHVICPDCGTCGRGARASACPRGCGSDGW